MGIDEGLHRLAAKKKKKIRGKNFCSKGREVWPPLQRGGGGGGLKNSGLLFAIRKQIKKTNHFLKRVLESEYCD